MCSLEPVPHCPLNIERYVSWIDTSYALEVKYHHDGPSYRTLTVGNEVEF